MIALTGSVRDSRRICQVFAQYKPDIVYHAAAHKHVPLIKSFKIHSKQFVYETLTGWGLDPEKTYSFKGEYLEEQKIVVFSLKSEDL